MTCNRCRAFFSDDNILSTLKMSLLLRFFLVVCVCVCVYIYMQNVHFSSKLQQAITATKGTTHSWRPPRHSPSTQVPDPFIMAIIRKQPQPNCSGPGGYCDQVNWCCGGLECNCSSGAFDGQELAYKVHAAGVGDQYVGYGVATKTIVGPPLLLAKFLRWIIKLTNVSYIWFY